MSLIKNRKSVKQKAMKSSNKVESQEIPTGNIDTNSEDSRIVTMPLENTDAKARRASEQLGHLTIKDKSYKILGFNNFTSPVSKKEFLFYQILIPFEHLKSIVCISESNSRKNYEHESTIDTSDIDSEIRRLGQNIAPVYSSLNDRGLAEIFDGQRRYTSVKRQEVSLSVFVHLGKIPSADQDALSKILNQSQEVSFLQMGRNLHSQRTNLESISDKGEEKAKPISVRIYEMNKSWYPSLLSSERVAIDAMSAAEHLGDYVIDYFGGERLFTNRVFFKYKQLVNKSKLYTENKERIEAESGKRGGMQVFSYMDWHREVFEKAKAEYNNSFKSQKEKEKLELSEDKNRQNYCLRILSKVLVSSTKTVKKKEKEEIFPGIHIELTEGDIDGKFKIEVDRSDISVKDIKSLLSDFISNLSDDSTANS